ncbi:MAG: molybdopterin molybdotransferase MoeA [Candidatus Schekmanbacteria bacterium]|nr:molybdopterin molybdotransferase MoeA [Candidatus Schekmanbacteria bacterium]
MISVEEALNQVLEEALPLPSEEVSLMESLGRVCAEDVVASITVPPWDNSAMDGFAVHLSDVLSASEKGPVKLKVIADIPAGKLYGGAVKEGECVRIMTGAPVPSDCDTVIMREVADDKGEFVFIRETAEKGENIREKGEDINVGDIVVHSGKRIEPADIGVMASVQVVRVKVYRQPVVAILSTGDELVDINEKITPGKIVTSNNYALEAQVLESGAVPLQIGIVKDKKDDIESALKKAMEADIILTTGGVSVGDYDFVKEVLDRLGFKKKFWQVAMKPGKPLTFGTLGKSIVFGLPGNPTATMLCFDLIVRPAILKMMGHTSIFRKKVKAESLEDIKKKAGRRHFLRVITRFENGRYVFITTGSQGSGVLTSMTKANSIAIMDEKATLLKKGDVAEVILLDEKI